MTAESPPLSTPGLSLIRWMWRGVVLVLTIVVGVVALAGVLWWTSLPDFGAIRQIEAVGGYVVLMDEHGSPLMNNRWDASILGGTGVAFANVSLISPTATDEHLRLLWRMPPVRSLDLSNSRITDEGLKELARMESLETLKLNGTPITGAGLQQLRGHPHLSELSTFGLTIPLEDIRDVVATWPSASQDFVQRTQYAIIERDFANQTGATLGISPGGPTVHVDSLNLPEGCLDFLTRLPDVTSFSLQANAMTVPATYNGFPAATFEPLAACEQLRSLSLHHVGVTDAHLAELDGMSHLQTLDIRDPYITALNAYVPTLTDAGLAHLRASTGLRDITIECANVTGSVFAQFTLDELESLSVSRMARLDDAVAAQWSPLRRLHKLTLRVGTVDPAAAAHLGSIPNLRELVLEADNVDIGFLGALASAARLESVELDNQIEANRFYDALNKRPVGPPFVSEMPHVPVEQRPSLAGLTSLKKLTLDYIKLSAEDVKWIAQLPALEELSLRLDDSAQPGSLVELGSLRTLQKLEISGDDLTGESYEFIKSMPELTHLSIRSQTALAPSPDEFRPHPMLQVLTIRMLRDDAILTAMRTGGWPYQVNGEVQETAE